MTQAPPHLLDPKSIRNISGFGMGCTADAYVLQPRSSQEAADCLAQARQSGRKAVIRGRGQSYGDPAILPEAAVINLDAMNSISEPDAAGVVEVEAGATLEQLWRRVLPRGYWPPVMSGTAKPSIGGAIAMNIHGKNAFHAGSLGEHVEAVEAVFPNGETRQIKREDEDFWHMVGGFGLCGIITKAWIKLKPVVSPRVIVKPKSIAHWEEFFAAFEDEELESDYMVGWVDMFGRGRGLFHAARYDLAHKELRIPETKTTLVQNNLWRAGRMMTKPTGARLINFARHLSGLFGRGGLHHQTLPDFNFLFDKAPRWQEAFRPNGFLQFQAFLPKETALAGFEELERMQRDASIVSHLAVMKRHRPTLGPLSTSVDGYSLAMDFCLREPGLELNSLLKEMKEVVYELQGMFYLAKDQILEPGDLARQFDSEALESFRSFKRKVDPEGIISSAMAERLEFFPVS